VLKQQITGVLGLFSTFSQVQSLKGEFVKMWKKAVMKYLPG
jgi:fluoride ion exporter CrcB/FEX